MYYNYKDGISIRSVLDKRIYRKSGLYPIRICVTYKRIMKYYSTEKELSIEDWERLASTRLKNLTILREDVMNRFNLISKIVEELADIGEFSFDNLKKQILDTISPSRNIDKLEN